MTYIFLVAGKGTRLHPLTLNMPKCMYKLDSNTTVLQRMVSLIRKYDKEPEIVVVTGFQHLEIERLLEGVVFIYNPFFDVTNSIASLWFARNYLLNKKNVTLIDGDIVLEERLFKDHFCRLVEDPCIFLDSSIKTEGDYNVQVNNDKVLVMSKQLKDYYGEYAGITKLPSKAAADFCNEVCAMVERGAYDQWYENALVQMIFNNDFELKFIDVCDYTWTEVDEVGDLLLAKKIHLSDEVG